MCIYIYIYIDYVLPTPRADSPRRGHRIKSLANPDMRVGRPSSVYNQLIRNSDNDNDNDNDDSNNDDDDNDNNDISERPTSTPETQ